MSTQSISTAKTGLSEKILQAIVAIFIIVYLVNCLSPLRLHVDTLRYFAIKDCVELGCAPDSEAAKDYLPWGYTGLLLALSKIGLLNSFVIVLINCLFLLGSLFLVWKIMNLAGRTYLFLALVLLNWTTIKFTVHPLSEMQYLFFSMASLYYFIKFTKTKSVLALLLAFGSAGVAFVTRSVGVALAAALVAGLLWMYREQLINLVKKNKIVIAVLLVIVIGVVVFSKQLGLDHYTGVFSKQFDEGVGFTDVLGWHFTEWSELFVNTSQVKVLGFIPAAFANLLFIIGGIVFTLTFLYFLLLRKSDIPFIVKAYLVFYAVLMFNWPFYDPRFWVPLVPLIAAVLVQARLPLTNLVKGLRISALSIYILLGVISVGYFTYTSLDKKVFAKTQANGAYRNEYETAFFGKPTTDTAQHFNKETYSVLERYEK